MFVSLRIKLVNNDKILITALAMVKFSVSVSYDFESISGFFLSSL